MRAAVFLVKHCVSLFLTKGAVCYFMFFHSCNWLRSSWLKLDPSLWLRALMRPVICFLWNKHIFNNLTKLSRLFLHEIIIKSICSFCTKCYSKRCLVGCCCLACNTIVRSSIHSTKIKTTLRVFSRLLI